MAKQMKATVEATGGESYSNIEAVTLYDTCVTQMHREGARLSFDHLSTQRKARAWFDEVVSRIRDAGHIVTVTAA